MLGAAIGLHFGGAHMSYCESCGEYTTKRGVFGGALCAPCHEAEDEAIEQVERRTAARLGYRYGWSDDEQPRPTPQARKSSER